MKERPAPEAKFNYAWALIRSKPRADIKRGIALMTSLHADRFSDRDCLYYLALGNYRLEQLFEARRLLLELLERNPECRQAITLLDVVEDRVRRDGVIGVGLVGAVLVSAVGIALGLKKSMG